MADPPRAERWQRIDALYHGALAVPVDARARFLREACGGDVPLREEVEALLTVAASANGYFDPSIAPASGVARVTASLVGCEVGPYRVTALRGAGGMGEVYRAHDPRVAHAASWRPQPSARRADDAPSPRSSHHSRPREYTAQLGLQFTYSDATFGHSLTPIKR